MKNQDLDRLLSEVRNEQVDDRVVAQAGERVWNSIAGSPAAQSASHTLRSCEDFQSLIPGYLAKQLAPARTLLFEDHLHACVACRRAVEQSRPAVPQQAWRVESKKHSARWLWPSLAGTAVVAAIVIAVFAFTVR